MIFRNTLYSMYWRLKNISNSWKVENVISLFGAIILYCVYRLEKVGEKYLWTFGGTWIHEDLPSPVYQRTDAFVTLLDYGTTERLMESPELSICQFRWCDISQKDAHIFPERLDTFSWDIFIYFITKTKQ